ncbi:DASS family sodium-coupled anion symporter [Glycocaulis profundi]|nr:DASS family sodium-coupled anion symporter [Glycocaulis profundi]
MRARYQWVGFFAGPALGLAVALFFRPEGLPEQAALVAGLGILMAVWWATEAIPVAATAFAPLIVLPLLGLGSFSEAAAPYANPVIFLFLGGFVIALAIERCGLHRRIAFALILAIGSNARRIIAGFMLATALVSMWISNTSSSLMLLPIAVSVAVVMSETMPDLDEGAQRNFATALLLGVAYAATIGGLATLIGTPPNAFLAAFMQETYDIEIGFLRWMLVGVPLMIVMLPIAWFMLVRVIFPIRFEVSTQTIDHIRELRRSLGKPSAAEIRTAALFLSMVTLWVAREPLQAAFGLEALSDAGIAIAAALAAFLIPSGEKGRSLMDWESTKQLPWGVLILFGGGLSLAAAVSSSGLALWMGEQLAPLGAGNILLLIIVATILVIFLTELTSNLGTTATFLPVIAAIAMESGDNIMLYVVPVTLAASCAFMLPVATPPNAIVFSSGRVSIPQMVRAGFWLNMIAAVIATTAAVTLVPLVF